MTHHLERVLTDETEVDGHGPVAVPTIRHRRLEENLPLFGRLVEYVDQTELHYHEREDARNIELFFDLFFVAIFSTFTKNHEINSRQALSSYAVYFGLIWASWLQICLFDVRFGFDSVFERFTKAVQMCAFIGFASASGCLQMDSTTVTKKKRPELAGFGALNVLMIISRGLFLLQYTVAYFLVARKHKPARKPLIMTAGMYAIATISYGLLLRFVISDMMTGRMSGFYGYYVIIAFELGAISFIAYKHPCVGFRGTNIHKRLMVLTLMILGEGIIVCAFSFAKISSKTGWTANSFGQALCVILSIYFIYCLYFGNSGIEHAHEFLPGKQQIYTLLHLPFHLCLALTLEGLRTWVIIANVQYNFRKASGYVAKVIGETPNVYRLEELNSTTGNMIVQTLNTTALDFGFEKTKSWDYMQTALTKMQLAWSDDEATITAGGPKGVQPNKNSVLTFLYNEFISLFQNEQFVANSLVVPDVQIKAAKGSGIAKMEAYAEVFKMIFIYFFVCAGSVIIILGVFRSMSIGPRDRYDNIAVLVRITIGVVLALLALFAVMDSYVTRYLHSGVLLPTSLFAFIFIVLFEKAITILAILWGRYSDDVGYDDEEGRDVGIKDKAHLLARDSWEHPTSEDTKHG